MSGCEWDHVQGNRPRFLMSEKALGRTGQKQLSVPGASGYVNFCACGLGADRSRSPQESQKHQLLTWLPALSRATRPRGSGPYLCSLAAPRGSCSLS